jgi:hypothetical protein
LSVSGIDELPKNRDKKMSAIGAIGGWVEQSEIKLKPCQAR